MAHKQEKVEINLPERTQPGYALLVTTLASFLNPFMGSSINLAVTAIGAEFEADALTLSWVITAFLLTSAAFLLPFGRLADLHGRKKIFLVGLGGYAFFSLLSAVAPSLYALILARVLQGISSAMIFSTAVAILTSVFPAQERGRVLGINAAAVYTGLAAGPFLGGVLTHNFGWRSIFAANFFLGFVTLLLALKHLKGEWVGAKGEKFDLLGSFLSTLSLAAVIYSTSNFTLATTNRWLLLTGLGGLTAFIIQEKLTRFPLLDVTLFSSNLGFAFSNLAALINYSATFATGFLLSIYLQVVRGLDPQTAGLVLLVQPIVQVLLSPVAGRLSDKVEPRVVASIGMALTSAGLLVLALLLPKASLGLVLGNLALLGMGFGLFSSPNTNAVMSSVPRKYYGVASSTLGTMRLLGQAFSMATVSLAFALYVGGLRISPAVGPLLLKSMRLAFSVFTALSIAGILASLARGKIHEQEHLGEAVGPGRSV